MQYTYVKHLSLLMNKETSWANALTSKVLPWLLFAVVTRCLKARALPKRWLRFGRHAVQNNHRNFGAPSLAHGQIFHCAHKRVFVPHPLRQCVELTALCDLTHHSFDTMQVNDLPTSS